MAGIGLGKTAPDLFHTLADLKYASVNLVVAALIWAMVYPMMVNVDFASLRHIGERPKGLIITLTVNWLIKPFTMAALGVLFFEFLFADLIAPKDAQEYIGGLILLGSARHPVRPWSSSGRSSRGAMRPIRWSRFRSMI